TVPDPVGAGLGRAGGAVGGAGPSPCHARREAPANGAGAGDRHALARGPRLRGRDPAGAVDRDPLGLGLRCADPGPAGAARTLHSLAAAALQPDYLTYAVDSGNLLERHFPAVAAVLRHGGQRTY